ALRTGEPIAPPAPVADADALVAAARHIAAEESITEAVAEPEPEPVAVPEPQPLPLPDLPDLELGPLSFDVPDAAAPTAPATQPLPTT
ncbi:hypothetical protein IA69_33205, partial [Massilia sp. JS1662]